MLTKGCFESWAALLFLLAGDWWSERQGKAAVGIRTPQILGPHHLPCPFAFFNTIQKQKTQQTNFIAKVNRRILPLSVVISAPIAH